jgi:hypothetical protein
MTRQFTKRQIWRVVGSSAVAAAAVACGGGGGEIIALLQIVTPLAGSWDNSTFTESINFLTPDPDTQIFQSSSNVTATVTSKAGTCGDTTRNGVAVAGTLVNGKLSLHLPAATTACLEGRFVDLRRLDAAALASVPAISYLNSRVDVRLQTGLWTSDNGKFTLLFNNPSSVDNNNTAGADGCDVSAATHVNFSGTMQGFNTTTLAHPVIPELRNGGTNALMFKQVEFVDGDTLKLLDATGQNLTLTRKPNTAGTVC